MIAFGFQARGRARERGYAVDDDPVREGCERRPRGVESMATAPEIEEEVLLDVICVHPGEMTAPREVPGHAPDMLSGAGAVDGAQRFGTDRRENRTAACIPQRGGGVVAVWQPHRSEGSQRFAGERLIQVR